MSALTAILALAGAAAWALALAAALSPEISRLLAAALLTHADTAEAARDFWRRAWARHERRLGVKLTRKEKEAVHGR